MQPIFNFFVEKEIRGRWFSCDNWTEDQYYLGCFTVLDKHCFLKEKTKEIADLFTGCNKKIEPIKPLSGLPKDISTPLRLIFEYEQKRGGEFSCKHTSYRLCELIKFFENTKHSKSMQNYIKKHADKFLKTTYKELKKIKAQKEVSDVRIIMWFD